MPEDCQTATPPVGLTVAAARSRGTALAGVQPGLQFAQEFIDATGQGNELLILGGLLEGFHSHIDYTCGTGLDVQVLAVD